MPQGETAAREETHKVEEEAIAAVGALSADLRRSLDKVRPLLSSPLCIRRNTLKHTTTLLQKAPFSVTCFTTPILHFTPAASPPCYNRCG